LKREIKRGFVVTDVVRHSGTWIPLPDGKELAQKNGVLEKLLPIFEFVPGDKSPPPAPKHATASSKPRAKPTNQNKRPQGKKADRQGALSMSHDNTVYAQAPEYDHMDMSMHGMATPDHDAFSESAFDEYDQSQYTNPRKRRRVEEQLTQADKEHQLWADELLDYFMLQDSPYDSLPSAPVPPVNADIDRPIDDKGHTALHWAASMGDIEVVKDLIRRGARIDVQSKNGETPLMRAVVFTNNYDRQNMEKLAGLLIQTVNMQEWYGSTVFHHIVNTTERKSKYQCARYYLDCILNKMTEVLSPDHIERVLNETDQNGDTAILIAARNGARKCVRSLICRNADSSITNIAGENAEQYIIELNNRRKEREHHNRQMSSSPFQGNSSLPPVGGAVQPHMNGNNAATNPVAALNNENSPVAYKSEAAIAMKNSVIPSVIEKFQSLTDTIESEMAEKEAELAEAERLVAARRSELEQLRSQIEELRAKEQAQTDGALDTDARLMAELDELMDECTALTMEEQNRTLHELFEKEKANSSADMTMDGTADDDETIREKLDLARELFNVMQQRHALVQTIVQNLSVAGFGNKQAEYRRLITGALRIREDEVEEALPGIVAELESSCDMEHVGA
jgi:ankyrin repeat protein